METPILPVNCVTIARYENTCTDIKTWFLRAERYLKERPPATISEKSMLHVITRYKEYVETLNQDIDAIIMPMSIEIELLQSKYRTINSKPDASEDELWELFSLARTVNRVYRLYAEMHKLKQLLITAINTHKSCIKRVFEYPKDPHPQMHYSENPAAPVLTWVLDKLP